MRASHCPAGFKPTRWEGRPLQAAKPGDRRSLQPAIRLGVSRDNLHLPRETGEEELMRLTLLRSTAALVLAVALLLFAFYIPAFAQNTASTATVDGVVADPSGAPVGGATVQLQAIPSGAGNRPEQTTSSADGHFRLDVPAGRYRLIVTHPSLRRYEQDLNLSPGQNPQLRAQLALEPLSSNVVVSSSAEPIEVNEASEPVSIV